MRDDNLTRKLRIEETLQAFGSGRLDENARELFRQLGYQSERRLSLPGHDADAFLEQLDPEGKLDRERALVEQWEAAHFLFQLTASDLKISPQLHLFEGDRSYEPYIQSYLFLAIRLEPAPYTRTQLSAITREVNKLFLMPAMILFQHGETVTLSIIDRRPSRRDVGQDVLEKVTLIKDVRTNDLPHRAHTEILNDLSIFKLAESHSLLSMDHLHRAWQQVLDSSELNKRFFQELSNWYFWAVQHVTFPEGAGEKEAVRNATSVIRLLTRLIFIWFLKEKGLVPQELFTREKVERLLVSLADDESTYYKAILQNLFFATLNQEMNQPGKEPVRCFRKLRDGGQAGDYMVHNLYRYERLFREPAAALELFENVPFLNGGLFECLDQREKGKPEIRVDGFSDHPSNPLHVPNFLFFSDASKLVDLNSVYGTSGKRYKVRGLIDLFNRYKFTIEENTPIEEEIALDPELLGQVFENLLAAYNPETEDTARRQTGSFYTPRGIVNFMVDESLILYLKHAMFDGRASEQDEKVQKMEGCLRRLFSYSDERHGLNEKGAAKLIRLIDDLDILDPACGSGAFPMGILQKLVFVLGKLDPQNERWKEEQIAKAEQIDVDEARRQAIEDIEEAFRRNELDYPRKLYLIEHCIYGVDIQPVAVQIAKLRFFISLVVDQKVDDGRPNRGIRPLPNLETKIVAANTLFDVQPEQRTQTSDSKAARYGQLLLIDSGLDTLEQELREVRRRLFRARTRATKNRYREQDRVLREQIAGLLVEDGFPSEVSRRLANWDPYDQNASADFFDPEWMFGVTEGFDVVISNPPYVRQEKLREFKPTLKQQYQTYSGYADLYVYFYERAYQLLQEGGVLCYISSNKYFRARYGESLRGFLSQKSTIHQLIDFGDANVFTAIAYPSIILLQKRAPDSNSARVLEWEPDKAIDQFEEVYRNESFLMPQAALTADAWQLITRREFRLLEKIRNAGTPLGEYVQGRFYRGILTGLNDAFVIDRARRDELIAEHPSSAEIIKPFLRGRDVKRWRVEFDEQYLIFTRRGIHINDYPAIKKYLEKYRERLEPRPKNWPRGKAWPGRKPGPYEWYEIQDSIAYWEEFEQPKIVIPAIENTVSYAPDIESFYSNDKTSICIPPSVSYTLAILNSQVSWWLTKQTFAGRQGGYYEFKPMYVQQIPIPRATAVQKALIETLSEYLVWLYQHANPMGDESLLVGYLEQVLNGLVYELFFPEELVEAQLPLFQHVAAANLPALAEIPAHERLARLRALFDQLYDRNHPVRTTLYALQSLEEVRLIEGKT